MKEAPITTLFMLGLVWLVFAVVYKNDTYMMIGMMHIVGVFVSLAVRGE